MVGSTAIDLTGAGTTRVEAKAIRLEPLHRFHSYCARFPSELAESAIEDYSRPGDSIFDPFCGSGTSMVAGLARGRSVIGSDIDILAGMLSDVKCAPRTASDYTRWRKTFAEKLSRMFAQVASEWADSGVIRPGSRFSVGELSLQIPEFPELNYWFPPQLATALAAIAEAAHQCRDKHYEKVALVSLSASIVAKWPNTLSYAMDIDHTRPHRRIQRFRLGRVLNNYLSRLDRTIECLATLRAVYANAGMGKCSRVVFPHDARTPLPKLAEESQTLVISSPPYFNAVDYPRAHRMSVCWMNGHAPADLASRQNYIGLHRARNFDSEAWLKSRPKIRALIPAEIGKLPSLERQLTGFFADLEAVLEQMHRVLKPAGHAVLVIGDNLIKGQRVASHAAVVEMARLLGFAKREASAREIKGLRRRYPVGPFGFDGPMTHEFVVVLQKSARKIKRKEVRDDPGM